MSKISSIGFMWAVFFLMTGCEEFVSIPGPSTQLSPDKVFADNQTAESALASVYFKMSEDIQGYASGGGASVSVLEGIYADELTSYLPPASQSYNFYFNNVSQVNGLISTLWTNCYSVIYESNRIIEGVSASDLSPSVKNQLIGEATFIRGFTHFYLVNIFGPVPLITSSDYVVNAHISRSPVDVVYKQVISDLKRAKDLLTDNYPSEGRVRANRGAATAMLARVFLYTGDFENAELEASEIISNTSQYHLEEDLNQVFKKTSSEAIWQIMPQGGIVNYTYEGSLFIFRAQPTSYSLRSSLRRAFEKDDLRARNWIDSIKSESGLTTWYFPFKYKENHLNATGTEYSMVLRLAEQYLIRAEARARRDNLSGPNSAASDLTAIRARAGLQEISSTSQQEFLALLENERQLELFTEWGHRFFDLKRTGRLDNVLGAIKQNWTTTDRLLPVPQNEILANTNLKPQNDGY
jgi:hypothetical protein